MGRNQAEYSMDGLLLLAMSGALPEDSVPRVIWKVLFLSHLGTGWSQGPEYPHLASPLDLTFLKDRVQKERERGRRRGKEEGKGGGWGKP